MADAFPLVSEAGVWMLSGFPVGVGSLMLENVRWSSAEMIGFFNSSYYFRPSSCALLSARIIIFIFYFFNPEAEETREVGMREKYSGA